MKSMRAPFTMPSPGVRRTMRQLFRLLRIRKRATRTMTPRRLSLARRLLRIRKVLMPAPTGSISSPRELAKSLTESSSICLEAHPRVRREISWTWHREAARAACRESFLYTGVVASEKHATLIQASLRLNIVKELILNRRDGYQSARYLKKSRSLSSKLDAEMSPCAHASTVSTAGASPSPSPAAPSPLTAPLAVPSVPSSFGPGIADDDEDF